MKSSLFSQIKNAVMFGQVPENLELKLILMVVILLKNIL